MTSVSASADASGRHLNQSYLAARHLLRICKAGFSIQNWKPGIRTDITAQGPFNTFITASTRPAPPWMVLIW